MLFPCRAHALPLPCRSAKGLDCVFPILFTQCLIHTSHAGLVPCHYHAFMKATSQNHGTAEHVRDMGMEWHV
jgi:hypothetical protein